MKRLIVLRHVADRGKTGTLKELRRLLLPDELSSDESYDVIEDIVFEDGDIRLVVKWHDKVIGIESKGDPGSNLKNRLEDMIEKHNVDYLFCATRTKGDTVYDVREISKTRNYEILWTSTYCSDSKMDIDFFNKQRAKHLFDLLIELINQVK
jgi:hypothetical protein